MRVGVPLVVLFSVTISSEREGDDWMCEWWERGKRVDLEEVWAGKGL
jgi:hypothetical protein